jgi:KDO2-lipid IV(A) lauroyltransferase
VNTTHQFSNKPKRFKLRHALPGWDRVEYFLLRIAICIIQLLPLQATTWLAQRVGDFLFFVLSPTRRRIALENIAVAYGESKTPDEKQKIARESFQNTATSILEFFRIPKFIPLSKDRISFHGTEHLDQAFKKGKGVILVISHLGSWEYLAFLPFLRKYPCAVVVRPIANRFIYNWVQRLRELTTLMPIDKKKSAKKILVELKNNHVVAILIDQWAGPEGIAVPFFGSVTSTTSVPARLAHHTGAALIPAYCIRLPDERYSIEIEPEVSLQTGNAWELETTRELNQKLEAKINAHPEQWPWGHRRWKKMPQ